MTDIVQQLRDRAYSSKAVDTLCERAADEIARLRLTDEERAAISRVYDLLCDRSRELQSATRLDEARPLIQWAKTLQGLWERLSGSAAISGAGKSAPAANTPPTLTDAERFVLREMRDIYADEDVVTRINRWLEDEDAADADETLHDARDEIVALRALLKRQSEAAHQAVTMMGRYAEQTGFLLGGLEMTAAGHTTAGKVLEELKAKYRD